MSFIRIRGCGIFPRWRRSRSTTGSRCTPTRSARAFCIPSTGFCRCFIPLERNRWHGRENAFKLKCSSHADRGKSEKVSSRTEGRKHAPNYPHGLVSLHDAGRAGTAASAFVRTTQHQFSGAANQRRRSAHRPRSRGQPAAGRQSANGPLHKKWIFPGANQLHVGVVDQHDAQLVDERRPRLGLHSAEMVGQPASPILDQCATTVVDESPASLVDHAAGGHLAGSASQLVDELPPRVGQSTTLHVALIRIWRGPLSWRNVV